jgi:hypothetical protein
MVTRVDLRLLAFYSMLRGLFLELSPQQMATAVAPPMGEKGKELVQRAYDRVCALSERVMWRCKGKGRGRFCTSYRFSQRG